MRRVLIPALLASAALAPTPLVAPPAGAQQPPKLEPLPAPPPAPPGASDPVDERPIRITPGRNEQVEETVIDGRRVVRVTTPSGNVYYLDDTPNDRTDSPSGPRVRVPLWVIHSF